MSVGLLLLSLLLTHPDLDEGRVAFSAMKYRAAVPALTRVTQDGAAADAEVQEALTLLARSHLALKAPEAAEAAFEALLRRSPMAEEPAGSPALRALFQKAKVTVFPPGTVRLSRRQSGEDTLLVEVVNPWRVALVATWYQVRPVASSRVLAFQGAQVVASLPVGTAGYLELTKDGQVVAALGSRGEPILGPAGPMAEPPLPPSDAPKTDIAPVLAPVATPAPAVTPPAPLAPVVQSRRVAGWSLLGAGIATAAAGAGVIAWGSDDRRRGDGFPFTTRDLTEAEALKVSGDTKMLAGGIVGGVGVTGVIIGVIVLLTQ